MLHLKEIFSFDQMIAPIVIKAIFWLAVALSVFYGLLSFYYHGFFLGLILAAIKIAFGVLLARVFCEVIIILFKMHERLISIDEKVESAKTETIIVE